MEYDSTQTTPKQSRIAPKQPKCNQNTQWHRGWTDNVGFRGWMTITCILKTKIHPTKTQKWSKSEPKTEFQWVWKGGALSCTTPECLWGGGAFAPLQISTYEGTDTPIRLQKSAYEGSGALTT